MNVREHRHHPSVYRMSDESPSPWFRRRMAVWLAVGGACLVWVLTHAGCAHPLGNGVASLVAFGFVPLRLVCLVLSEAGVE